MWAVFSAWLFLSVEKWQLKEDSSACIRGNEKKYESQENILHEFAKLNHLNARFSLHFEEPMLTIGARLWFWKTLSISLLFTGKSQFLLFTKENGKRQHQAPVSFHCMQLGLIQVEPISNYSEIKTCVPQNCLQQPTGFLLPHESHRIECQRGLYCCFNTIFFTFSPYQITFGACLQACRSNIRKCQPIFMLKWHYFRCL